VGLWASRFEEFLQRGWRGELLVWRQTSSRGDSLGDRAKNPAGEKLNHERPNRIRKGGLASEVYRRRCQTVNNHSGAIPRASVFVGGNPDSPSRVE